MVNIIDTSNIISIVWSMFVKMKKEQNGDDYVIEDKDLGLFWHMFFKKVKDYFITYEKNVFCFEGYNSTKWRKEIYPAYKANRDSRKEDPNYAVQKKIFPLVEQFLKLFSGMVLRVDNCEGDDCIYAAAKYFTNKGEQVNIISSDGDLKQIMNFFDGVTIYNPIKGVNVPKNENILIEKAMIGDTSDNIKGVPKIGAKTLEKMLQDNEFYAKKMTPENVEVFNTIMKIVDLRLYPKQYQDAIFEVLEREEWNEFKKMEIEAFFVQYGLKQCLDEWHSISGQIEMLLNGNAKVAAESELEELLNG